MISVSKLKYSVGTRDLLSDVSFSINSGDKVALVGPNGAGKSTLIKIIMGETIPDSGSIIFSNNKPTIGYMPQEISGINNDFSLSVLEFMLSGRGLDVVSKKIEQKMLEMNQPNLSMKELERLAGEYSENFELFMARGGFEAEEDLLDILEGIGLSTLDLDQKVSELSGGQKTKLAFAKVLFSEPELLILDEPTNHLDEDTINWFIKFIQKYNGALLIVSHVAKILDVIVSRVIYLNGSALFLSFKGNYSDFLRKKNDLEKAQLSLRTKQEREVEKLESVIKRWRGKKPRLVSDREKKLEKIKNEMIELPKQQIAATISFPVKIKPDLRVLDVINISKSFREKLVLKNVSLNIQNGEKIAILGPNGAGKTTLLKIIASRMKFDTGQLIVGKKVDIGYYAQEHELLNSGNTLISEMESVSNLSVTQTRSVLAHFLFFGDKVFNKVSTLSLGERSRLAMAKIVIAGHNLLILDEPTNHLDFLAREKIKEALKLYQGSLIIVSHDLQFIKDIGVEKALILPENKFDYLRQLL